MVLALVAAGTVRADEERPTDPYTGEVITWDVTYDVLSMGHEVAYQYTGSNITSSWETPE